MVLRGPQFKFHQFAGGKTALYDVDADPGETTDVSAAFPEVAERYRAGLEKQYQQIIESGRAYRLPYTKIRQRSGSGYNKFSSGSALRIDGDVHPVEFFFVKGFSAAGDRVDYEVEVIERGRYVVRISGSDLQNGKEWAAEIDGRVLSLKKATGSLLEFDAVELPEGRMVLTLSTVAQGTRPEPFPKEIYFIHQP